MNNILQDLSTTYAQKEWAEAYLDLKEDELMQLYVMKLNRNRTGQRLLEQARQIWQEQGLTAPFDFIVFEAEYGLRRKEYFGSRDYYQALSQQ